MYNIDINNSILILIILLLIFIFFNNSYNNNNKEGFSSKHQNHKSLQKWASDNGVSSVLNNKLSEFYINSSHNTYINGLQIGGTSSANNLVKVLNAGARCVELDIHERKGSPIVAHIGAGSETTGKILGLVKSVIIGGDYDIYSTTTTPLEDYLKVFKNNAFKDTNDPLIVYLEIFNSENVGYMKEIRDGFKKYVGNFLYEGTMDKFNKSNYFLNVPIKKLLGKIIIVINYYNMTNKYNRDEYIYPICHGTTDEPNGGWFGNEPNVQIRGMNSSEIITYKPQNQLVRVFPDNVLGSSNYNPDPFWASRYNIVSMNFQTDGTYLEKNDRKFKYCSFVPQNVIISPNGKVNKTSETYEIDGVNFGPLYRNIIAEREVIMPFNCYCYDTKWISENGDYYLIMQYDGNLVLYEKKGKAKWSSKTGGNSNSVLCMQADGNLVIYNSNKKPIWNSGTHGNIGAYAGITDGTFTAASDFNIYNSKGDVKKQIY